jgi:hypothetical protein
MLIRANQTPQEIGTTTASQTATVNVNGVLVGAFYSLRNVLVKSSFEKSDDEYRFFSGMWERFSRRSKD